MKINTLKELTNKTFSITYEDDKVLFDNYSLSLKISNDLCFIYFDSINNKNENIFTTINTINHIFNDLSNKYKSLLFKLPEHLLYFKNSIILNNYTNKDGVFFNENNSEYITDYMNFYNSKLLDNIPNNIYSKLRSIIKISIIHFKYNLKHREIIEAYCRKYLPNYKYLTEFINGYYVITIFNIPEEEALIEMNNYISNIEENYSSELIF